MRVYLCISIAEWHFMTSVSIDFVYNSVLSTHTTPHRIFCFAHSKIALFNSVRCLFFVYLFSDKECFKRHFSKMKHFFERLTQIFLVHTAGPLCASINCDKFLTFRLLENSLEMKSKHLLFSGIDCSYITTLCECVNSKLIVVSYCYVDAHFSTLRFFHTVRRFVLFYAEPLPCSV